MIARARLAFVSPASGRSKIGSLFAIAALLLVAGGAHGITPVDVFSLEGRDHRFVEGDDPRYALVTFDDSDSLRVMLPGSLEAQGIEPARGCGWYRIRFELPPSLTRAPLAVSLGLVWGADEIHLNGQRIAATGAIGTEAGWVRLIVPYTKASFAELPESLLDREGENLLAVRVCNGVDAAGIVNGPAMIGDARVLQAAKAERDRLYHQVDAAFAGSAAVVILVWLAFAARLPRSPGIWALGAALVLGFFVILGGSLLVEETGRLTTGVYATVVSAQFAAPLATLFACWRLFELGRGRLFAPVLVFVVGSSIFGLASEDRALARSLLLASFAAVWILYAMLAVRVVAMRTKRPRDFPIALATIALIAVSGAFTTWSSFVPSPPDWTSRYATLIGYWIVPLFLLYVSSRRIALMQNRIAELSTHVLTGIENERRSIARELHDGVAQDLQAAKMRVDLHDRSASEPDVIGTDDLAEGIRQLRSVAQALHPVELEEGDLTDQIAIYAESFAGRSEFQLDLDLDEAPVSDVLDATRSAHVFRIVQEALGNCARHARAHHVEVRIADREGVYELTIRDDGVGIGEMPRGRAGIGLDSMRERAELVGGRLEILAANPGTCVRLRVPHRAPRGVDGVA